MWLVEPDGTAVSVHWPVGFTARFYAPGAEPAFHLLDQQGDEVVAQGELVSGGQLAWHRDMEGPEPVGPCQVGDRTIVVTNIQRSSE